MSPGHVFVTKGNLLNLKSDAWLLSTDRRGLPSERWRSALPHLKPALASHNLGPLKSETAFAVALNGWELGEPMPVLTAVPFEGVRSAEQLGPRFKEFLDVGTATSLERRRGVEATTDRPLLATPFFGTGRAGGTTYRGEILKVLLDEAYEHVAETSVDVVFVFEDPAAFALAQQLRRNRELSSGSAWSAIDGPLLTEAKRLGGIAEKGELVPFMGAGVSVSAGAPTWEELLRHLALTAGLDDAEIAALDNFSILDRADVLKTFYSDRSVETDHVSFGEAVASAVRLPRYGLAPTLLACLPSKGAITLNYDELFEQASKDSGIERSVIPGKQKTGGENWLLKLHGSVAEPETIVLTRDDYLGYGATKEALSALVKAHLITHHLLFVGFGLADDHFHEIVHDVRRALPAAEASGHFGTALMLHPDAMRERLWGNHLRIISMTDAATDVKVAARSLEIFLDALVAYSSDSHSFLLAPHYERGLTDGEKELRNSLMALTALPVVRGGASAGPVIQRMLRELGWDGQVPETPTSASAD